MDGSYWQRDAGWTERWGDHAVPHRVDFAVIGGGLAGLSTAIRLRERHRGAEIAVLEAERVGWGASGRNAGFLSPLAAPVWLMGAARHPDHAWASLRINDAVHQVAKWLSTIGGDSEVTMARYTMEGTGALSDAGLREFADALDRIGLACALRPSVVRPSHLALEMPGYLTHPYKLVLALAEHAIRSDVHIRERARVRAIESVPAGAVVRIVDGSELFARRVVVCTNAYTSSLELGERVRALVVYAYMMASAPLDLAQTAALIRDGDFTLELDFAQAFHRMHQHRMVFGGGDTVFAPSGGDHAVPSSVRTNLVDQLGRTFRHASAVGITDAWGGRFHVTSTGLPIIRTSHRNPAVVLNVGYGGTGVALTLACSRLAAAVASDDTFERDEDARLFAIIQATRPPLANGLRTIGRLAKQLVVPSR